MTTNNPNAPAITQDHATSTNGAPSADCPCVAILGRHLFEEAVKDPTVGCLGEDAWEEDDGEPSGIQESIMADARRSIAWLGVCRCPTNNPNAPANPPAGDVPAARPEGEPGEAAVFVDWEAVAREAVPEHLSSEWLEAQLAKHTHPAPVGLAARMRDVLARSIHPECARVGAACLRGRGDGTRTCERARAVFAEATPAAVAALDLAAAVNQDLAARLNGALAERDGLLEKCATARKERDRAARRAQALLGTAEELLRQLDAWGCELPGPVWRAAEALHDAAKPDGES